MATETKKMWEVYAGIFFISAATLLLELALARIFDVLLYNNLAYLVVSSAIFGFGLGGITIMLWPLARVPSERLLALAAAGFAALVVLLIPAIKYTPADLGEILAHPFRQLLAFGGLYLCLLAPFFAAGLAIAVLVTRYAARIHQLYCWDLAGAGIGCSGIFILPALIGGEETLLVVAVLGALAAALCAAKGSPARWLSLLAAAGVLTLAVGLANRIEFDGIAVKRGVMLGATGQGLEFSRWDPVSRIDILAQEVPWRKRIAYDGGAQSSALRRFDGDPAALRERYFEVVDGQNRYNSGKYVALAHWLKRESGARTLIIGSAGGQETLAALAWDAAHVDAVEMVCTVIAAAVGPYADFTGHLFHHPRVTVRCDEGRSFLRQSRARYDIIQIHSNHTTSSLANGSGGAMPVYLQTVEAYREYFSHLSEDGILQINYFGYPRMLTTAARAWSELFPGTEFKRHLVITSGFGTMLPTFLVKRSAWTAAETTAIRRYLGPDFPDPRPHRLIYAPAEPEERNVPPEFFAVPLDRALAAALPYKIFPPTDDRPFFRDLRKDVGLLAADEKGYVTEDTAGFLNASLKGWIPMESAHLYLLGGLAVVVAGIVTLVPLLWLRRRGLRAEDTIPSLIYFSCLGAGFVIVELVLISKFILLVGFPIYAMATVLLTLLLAAGGGSYVSARVSRAWGRWAILVIPIFALIMVGLVVVFPALRDLTLEMGQGARILVVAVSLIPVGIPLGMPFPLGIEALQARAPHLIPWAWGINGFMTVVGSLLSVILAMKLGFDATLLVAVAIYLIAVPSFLAINRGRLADKA